MIPMEQKFRAILLRKIKYGEKSAILRMYTRESGTTAFFLKSIVRSKEKKLSLPPLGLFEVVAHGNNNQMSNIRELKLENMYLNIASEVNRSALVMFLNEVLINALPDYHADDEMFDFIYGSLINLEESNEINPSYHLAFLMRLSRFLGFGPDRAQGSEKAYFDIVEGVFVQERPPHSQFIEPPLTQMFDMLLNMNTDLNSMIIPRPERQLLLSKILDFYKAHLTQFRDLKSLEVLTEVFG